MPPHPIHLLSPLSLSLLVQLKEVDDRYRVSERVGDVVKQGVEKVKQAVDKLDE